MWHRRRGGAGGGSGTANAKVGLVGAVLTLARLGVISDAATISTLTTAR